MLLKNIKTDLSKICRLCLYRGFDTEVMSFYRNPDLLNKIKDCVNLDVSNTKLVYIFE